jgi:hypothetical protein
VSRLLVAMLLGAAALPAAACGACDEDKVAATYDHAVVQRAAAAKKLVVFCAVQGPHYSVERARGAARRTAGVDVASVRTSSQPPTLSFAVDARKRTVESAVAALQHDAPAGTRISIVRVLGNAGI